MDKYPLTKMVFKSQSLYRTKKKKKPKQPSSSDVANRPISHCHSVPASPVELNGFHSVFSSTVIYRPGKNGDHGSRLYLETSVGLV